jgi:ligand-binding sensor domain-containing protein
MTGITKVLGGHVWYLRLLLALSITSDGAVLALNGHRSIAEYVHNTWTFQSGLPADVVNDVLQTRDGYIWLATSAGLYRFDGVSFSEISTNPENDEAHETINKLYETSDGSLWIGTRSNGLRVLRDGRMQQYDSKDGFFTTGIRGFLESRSGNFYVATNIGIFLFKNGKFDRINLDQNFINGIAEDSRGRIWVGSPDGVRIFDDNGSTNPAVVKIKKGLPYPSVLDIFRDQKGNMWVGTYGGVAEFNGGKVTTYSSGNGLSNDRCLTIFEDSDGNIWVGTEKGINRFTDGVWTNFTNSDGLTDNEVWSFAEDREHSLWVGTADGLNQFEDPNIITYTTNDGMADNHVSTIVQTRDSSIYFFSDQSTVITQLKDGKFTKYNDLNIPGGNAFASRDGSVWSGQTGIIANFKDGKVKTYDEKNGIPPKWISAIAEDDKSLIFYVDHTGLFRLINGHAVPYLLKDGTEYPKNDYIVCFLRQKDGTLWIGRGDGLARIKDGVFSTFDERPEVSTYWISSFYDDPHGGLWISSAPGGLILYKNGKFTYYDTKVGLFSDEIDCVVGDDSGDIWLSSGKGIGFVKRQELEDFAAGKIQKIHSVVYSSADGVKANPSFNRGYPSGIKAYDGNIWFATEKGAMVITPGGFRKNELPPPVLIEGVVGDERGVPVNKFATFSAGTDKLEFHYTALSFKVPLKVKFKYKLGGYDRDWVDAGTRRVAYYTNLPPGEYNFEVIASNNDGVWNKTGASFGFEIKPHFYETYWFLISMLIIVGGAAFGAYRLRVWQLLKKEKELNERIQEALANIKTLGGLIPICSNCKKIRDDKGYWEILEKYVQTHSEAQFSHGICPECAAKLYPDFTVGKGEKGPEV